MNYSGKITDILGITVGHHTDLVNGTGCTVILCENPAIAGMEIRGAAPGSRETALLDPLASALWINGIVLTGGSAFGLDAPGGVVRYLEEKGVGVKFGRMRIPLVPAAVVFDLGFINGVRLQTMATQRQPVRPENSHQATPGQAQGRPSQSFSVLNRRSRAVLEQLLYAFPPPGGQGMARQLPRWWS